MNEPRELIASSKRFGSYLRRLREEKKLTLEAVAEMSAQFPEKITKSHLSRLENGQAIPSFGRLYTLGRIYGVPAGNLAEQLELDLEIEHRPPDLEGLTDEQVLDKSKALMHAGDYREALKLCRAAVDREPREKPTNQRTSAELHLHIATCLLRTGHYSLAKDEAEKLLSRELESEQRVRALLCLVGASAALQRYPLAAMALREAQSAVAFEGVSLRLKAHVSSWQGKISLKMGDYESAQRAYQEARDLFEQVQDEFEACRAQIDVGQVMIRRGLCRQAESIILAARKEAEDKGFARLHALALGHLVIIAFTNAQLDEAEAYALRSNILARECDFTDLVFRNCVYLWKIAVARGDERLRRLNEKTLRVLLPRVDQELKEAIEFREFLAGGEA